MIKFKAKLTLKIISRRDHKLKIMDNDMMDGDRNSGYLVNSSRYKVINLKKQTHSILFRRAAPRKTREELNDIEKQRCYYFYI